MTALAPPPTPVARLRARGRVRGGLPLLGPAFVAGIAYVDPGNFATNAAAGSSTGYRLLWVVVLANAVAVLVQSLSAKVGLATGQDLAQLCRRHFPRGVVRGLWLQAELVAMATDLAEVIGGAIALRLLFGLPLLVGGALTGVVALGLLALQRRGYRQFELVVAGLFAVILLGVLAELLLVHVDPGAAAAGLVPGLAGPDSVLLATGILGATVMPHAVYLHSALTCDRVAAVDAAERRHLLRHQRIDVGIAMGLAGAANLAMLVVAAAVFGGGGAGPADSLPALHDGLGAALGPLAADAFAVALLASGFASSGVGTLSGQVVMQGFAGRSVPLVLRRGLTLAPALLALALGAEPTRALVLSQVVLSFGLPFVLVPLVLLTRRPDVMHELVNRPTTTALAACATTGVVVVNAVLLVGLAT
ncbi:MAG: divalent metal cation transporter [Frankiales bacterium]|nr:divalent metal cation transporter [Frankiales bacterium]